MVLVKILGLIDLFASLAFLSIIFSIGLPIQVILFLGATLFVKGLFILTGDLLSVIDLLSAVVLLISIFFTPALFFLWTLSLLLMSKGAASFL